MPVIMIGPNGEELMEPTIAPCVARRSAGSEDIDAALAMRCRDGDMSAFGELVSRHEKRIYALVSRILGATASADDVDDTVQDVFVQAWRALPRFRGDSKFSTWLYRIATNMAIKQWHRRKRLRLTVADEELPENLRVSMMTDPSPSPADHAESQARDRALRASIDALPEKQRTVVLLHYFEDYSCEEVAQVIGCSVGTVWSRLHYACRKLRGNLEWLQQA